MRILLINPPIPHINLIQESHGEEEEVLINKREMMGPPLALNDIAGALRDEAVRIVDQKFENDAIKNYDFENRIYEEINEFGPEIVGISCFTAHVNSAKKICKIVKDFNPNVLTVIGGLHTVLRPADFCIPEVDLIALGLGKKTMRSIVDAFKSNPSQPEFSSIPGLGMPVDGKLKYTRQLSELSRQEIKDDHYLCYEDEKYFPDRELTSRYPYIIESQNKQVHYINTALGCTDKCNFCGLWKFANGYYIPRQVSSIINEIKTMEEYPIIRMVDAHTFGNIEQSKLLFKTLIEEGIDHEYIVDIRTDTVVKYPDMLSVAAEAGVKVAIMGFEATTDEELEKMGKRNTIANTINAIDTLHSKKILCVGNYIINPDYDEKDFERVAQFIDDHPVLFAGFTVMTPYPGTPQYEMMKDQIIIDDLDYYNLTNAVVKTRLPENIFYSKMAELYKLSMKSRIKFMKQMGIELKTPGQAAQ